VLKNAPVMRARAQRRWRAWAGSGALLIAGALTAVPVCAAAEDAPSIHRSPHLEHTEWIFGLIAVQSNSWVREEEGDEGRTRRSYRDGWGGGAFLERSLLRDLLEGEVGATVIPFSDGTKSVSIDVLLKKAFHVTPVVNPYLAFGGTATIEIEEDRTVTRGGIVASTGVYLWMTDHFGADVDLIYTAFPGVGSHELQIAVGPVVRF
jgi:hypothetical protein